MKFFVIPGISNIDSQKEFNEVEKAIKNEVSKTFSVSEDDITVINPEKYFDESNLDFISKLVLKAAMFALKAKMPAAMTELAEVAGEPIRDKSIDVWTYLNPWFHRTRDIIDQAVAAELVKHPTCVVIGHSLGSLVALRALKKYNIGSDMDVELITIGSPFHNPIVQKLADLGAGSLGNVRKWVNYYSPNDIVARHKISNPDGDEPNCQWDTRTNHKFENYLEYIRAQRKSYNLPTK